MTAQMILHIGPPKSATTSMQIALQAAESASLSYGGAFQPRESDEGSTAQALHDYARRALSSDAPSVRRAVQEIRDQIERGCHPVISEEMFLVDSRSARFTDKLARVRDLLDGVPIRVVLSLRDPAEGLPSYYQEIFDSLPPRLKLSFRAFCKSQRAKCFDYRYVGLLLADLGFEETWYVSVDRFSEGPVGLNELLGPTSIPNEPMEIGLHNKGTVTVSNRRELPRTSLRGASSDPFVGRTIRAMKLRHLPGYETARSALLRVTLRPQGSRVLTIPRSVGSVLQESFQSASARMKAQVGSSDPKED